MGRGRRNRKEPENPEIHCPLYLVERVIDKRFRNGNIEYLLKWRDYDESHNSWEPKRNLLPAVIQMYEDQVLKKVVHFKEPEKEEPEEPKNNTIGEKMSPPKDSPSVKKEPGEIQMSPEMNKKESMNNTKKSHPKDSPSAKKEPGEIQCPETNKEESMNNTISAKMSPTKENPPAKEEDVCGFDCGLEPEKILGACNDDETGELLYLMKWKGSEDANLVSARDANIICPQIVIAFLQPKIQWILPSCCKNCEKEN